MMSIQHGLSILGTLGLLALLTSCTFAPASTPSTSRAAPEQRAAAPAAPPAPETSALRGQSEPSLPSDQAVLGGRKIIYTGEINLEVQDPLATMEIVTRLAQQSGGYVASTNLSRQDDRQVVTMSLRVPAERYPEMMAQLRQLGQKVRDEKTTSQDVSEEYADLNAQLRNLEAAEAQYLDLLKRAQTIDDILKVQQQLTNVRGQIERIKGRLTYLERRTELATITVGLVPLAAGSRPLDLANPLDAAVRAWEASLRFLALAGSVAVTMVVFLWWALPPLALLVLWLLSRRRRRALTPSQPAT
ncbi:MAG: hypothetical protein KatS3mg061_0171 [Dehalococcoidia bacterium]|nr:MAG: hypothetical protein KatS3mg061_0171 [Dehalococcoidia bacterium]